jgi:hypothetical protein
MSAEPGRDLLRHTVATLAYRGAKAVRGAPDEFRDYRPVPAGRSAGQILAHVGDLLDWALSLAEGRQQWRDSEPLAWPRETERFFSALAALDARLADPAPLAAAVERIFQGPIADALTHVGQIAMLRRLAGTPMKGENYYKAEITAGRVGPDQAEPKREF